MVAWGMENGATLGYADMLRPFKTTCRYPRVAADGEHASQGLPGVARAPVCKRPQSTLFTLKLNIGCPLSP